MTVVMSNDDRVPYFLPKPLNVEAGAVKLLWFSLLYRLLHFFLWITMRASLAPPGVPDKQKVDAIYDRHASRYDQLHRIVTRGQDLNWRRSAGWALALEPSSSPNVLDLCTGTGLTILEMVRVLKEHARGGNFIGMDYNHSMLAVAKSRVPSSGSASKISFVRGDATNMTAGRGGDIASDFVKLQPGSVDFVSQVFGIGGISWPHSVFDNVLRVLKEGGRYYVVDMHCPISSLSGEVPMLGRWIKTTQLETYLFIHATLPLALERMWAWRDPTRDFYFAPLECHEEAGRYFGFRILYRVVESERWWFSLPLLPVCKMLLEKVQIGDAEFHDRRQVLEGLAARSAVGSDHVLR
jgi:ubiquinone/menaquinone biosynthesis C-methylase UbiE